MSSPSTSIGTVAVATIAAMVGFAGGLFVSKLNRKACRASSAAIQSGDSIEHDKPLESRMYEQTKALNEYLLLHYGEEFSGNFTKLTGADGNEVYKLDFGTALKNEFGNFGLFNFETGALDAPIFPSFALNFPARVAKLAAHFAGVKSASSPQGRALDVGCAVGRTTFELSNFFADVTGVDYSNAFIEAARKMATGTPSTVSVPIEGALNFTSSVSLAGRFNPEACTFAVGDATALDTTALGQFDCVTAANLIDRLPAPRAFLTACAQLVKPGGVLVITSPYTWLKEFTPQNEWLGGGHPVVNADGTQQWATTFEALSAELTGPFELVHQSHMPFLIRETGRKNQFTFAHATVWKRK
jgi:putative 4-mercaptohistidine N1-methyltranferase